MKQHHMQSHLLIHKPHVMLISETHLNPNYRIIFNDYIIIRNDRTRDNGGGTAILLKDNLVYEVLQPPTNINIESTIIKLKIEENVHFVLIAAYIPNQSLRYNELEQLMCQFGTNNVILGADLNAKHITWNNRRNNPNGNVLRNWADNNLERFHVLFPNEPTFLRHGRTPSILDCFIVSANIREMDQQRIQTKDFLSDHRAIGLEVILQDEIHTTEPESIWCWSRCNWNEFNIQVENELENLAIPENQNIDKF